jgi:hypothetical protein
MNKLAMVISMLVAFFLVRATGDINMKIEALAAMLFVYAFYQAIEVKK